MLSIYIFRHNFPSAVLAKAFTGLKKQKYFPKCTKLYAWRLISLFSNQVREAHPGVVVRSGHHRPKTGLSIVMIYSPMMNADKKETVSLSYAMLDEGLSFSSEM